MSAHTRLIPGILLAVLAVLVWAGQTWAVVTEPDPSRYEVIVARQPFGVPPPPPPTNAPPAVNAAPAVPPFHKSLELQVVIETTDGQKRVGFVNNHAKPPRTYMLYKGETSDDGITVADVDFEKECALLRRGTEEGWISMAGKGSPATGTAVGGIAPVVATPAVPVPITPFTGPRPFVSPAASPIPTVSMSFAERMRLRREALRQRVVEPPKLTGEELQKHLRETNLEYIRKGMPPLPIQLTLEEDARLVEEGVLPAQPGQVQVQVIQPPEPVEESSEQE